MDFLKFEKLETWVMIWTYFWSVEVLNYFYWFMKKIENSNELLIGSVGLKYLKCDIFEWMYEQIRYFEHQHLNG